MVKSKGIQIFEMNVVYAIKHFAFYPLFQRDITMYSAQVV